MEKTISADIELDWTRDPEFMDAQKRLRDVTGISEQRERERQLLWDCKFSDDPFSRARHRAEFPDADKAAALAEAYVHQARTQLATAEQQAKARVQPLWDDKFRESWRAIEAVVTGPLMTAIQDLETLSAEANQKNLTVPIIVPANLATESLPTWVAWVRGQLSLDK